MSRVLFINGNAYGHINPTLPLVKELQARGEEIVYYSTADFKERIEEHGAAFADYGEVLGRFLRNFKPSGNHPFYTLIEFMLQMDEAVIPIILEREKGKQYDYLIHDSMFGGGSILARLLGLPAVCSCSSFAMNRLPVPPHMVESGFHPQMDCFIKQAESFGKTFGVGTPGALDVFFKREKLNIVYTSKYFQPESGAFDDSFKFVGPSISQRNEPADFSLEYPDGRRVIYVSLGTINNECPDFYRKCMEAFAQTDCRVVMSVGRKTDIASLGEIPENFIVRNHVPQLEVLKKADAFISHGGLNSVSESLYYGVPLVIVPMANDQPMVARQVVSLGAGIGLKSEEITPELLRESIFRLLADGSYKAESRKIGDSFREAGGYRVAADYIMQYTSRTGELSKCL